MYTNYERSGVFFQHFIESSCCKKCANSTVWSWQMQGALYNCGLWPAEAVYCAGPAWAVLAGQGSSRNVSALLRSQFCSSTLTLTHTMLHTQTYYLSTLDSKQTRMLCKLWMCNWIRLMQLTDDYLLSVASHWRCCSVAVVAAWKSCRIVEAAMARVASGHLSPGPSMVQCPVMLQKVPSEGS